MSDALLLDPLHDPRHVIVKRIDAGGRGEQRNAAQKNRKQQGREQQQARIQRPGPQLL